MKKFLNRFIQVVASPERFFAAIRQEQNWKQPLLHLLVLSLWLSLGSVIAWNLGLPGDTPVNSSLGAQMDVYVFWQETLLPQFGGWAHPIAVGLIILEMLLITAIWTPVVFLIFRYLGGEKEPGGLLRAFQGFVYGLTPCAFGGFLPYLGVITGVYATWLQFGHGPAITLRNRSCIPYLFPSLILGLAIARYWQGALL